MWLYLILLNCTLKIIKMIFKRVKENHYGVPGYGESGEGMCHFSLFPSPPQPLIILRPALCPGATSTRLLSSNFWFTSLGASTSRRMREERWAKLENLLPHFPPCRIAVRWLCPLTEGLADLSVSRLWCSFLSPLKTQGRSSSQHPQLQGTALSLVVSPPPTNTFVNSPFIKSSSNYTIWVQHLFLAGLWLDTGLFVKIKVWETLT